jgi:hypothetical protein
MARAVSLAVGTALLIAAVPSGETRAQERFPTLRPATRAEAIATLAGGDGLPSGGLTSLILSLVRPGTGLSATEHRALTLLQRPVTLPGEERWLAPDGTLVRYTSSTGAFDRIPPDDANGSGRPDVVEQALLGLADARRLLVGELGLTSPGPLEILFADAGRLVDGYLVPGGGTAGRPLIVLEASTPADRIRWATAHQMAYAVALAHGPAIPPMWAESFATWTVSRLEGQPAPELLRLMSGRLDRLAEGLLREDPELAAGNAIWLTFLDEAYGGASVPAVMTELSTSAPVAVALDRAVRKISGLGLEPAFREFHLWSILVGERDDRRHFSFGSRLEAPAFASVSHGMPTFSVRNDPAVAPLGAISLLVRPESDEGGATVMFEGDVSGRWEVDLLLDRRGGAPHRVPFQLSPEGRGEITVPLDGVAEVVLLVRNLAIEDDTPRPFTWGVHRERAFPFDLGSLQATAGEKTSGVLVSWETLSERRLVGFNVVRTRDDSDEVVRVNPIWVPAVGDATTPISYMFIDLSAEPGVPYRYRVEGITTEGLTSRSEPVPVQLD